jgi:hypothetical protein
VGGDVRDCGGAAERLEQGAVGFGDGQPQFLEPAGDSDVPGAVAEVSLEFADDGRDGVAGEVDAAGGVEFVDGFDEADGGGLEQVVRSRSRAREGWPAGSAAIAVSSSVALADASVVS